MDWTGFGLVGCAFGVLWVSASASAQCADGTVDEVLIDGVVAGCAGAWTEKGVVDLDGAPVEPTCDRRSGNDGELRTAADMREEGTSCSAADLCAFGWSLCGDEDVVADVSCDDADIEDDAIYVAATNSCDGDLGAQVVGCGTLGCESDFGGEVCSIFDRQSLGSATDPCATLNRTACADGEFIEGIGWSCVADATDSFPAATVTKEGDHGGGVLCCFREVCDCVDETGECYASGESPEPCLVCEGDGDPVEPLTVIEDCSPDADAGAREVDGGVEPAVDLGPGPNGPDLGRDVNPEISFRGDGGCECRTAGEGAPSAGLLALVLFAFRRRR
jgi:MYXO-CTERM domain-containing protein